MMSGHRISVVYLGAEEGREAADEILGSQVHVIHPKAEPEAVAAALRSAHGLLHASMKVPISDAMIAASPD